MHDIPTSRRSVDHTSPAASANIASANRMEDGVELANGRAGGFLHSRPAMIVIGCALFLGFAFPLYRLVRFALQSSLYSYVLLVPFVSVYLFRLRSKQRAVSFDANRTAAAILIGLGTIALGCFGAATMSGIKLVEQDSLSLTTFSFVFMFAGTCALLLDKARFRSAAFSLGFLVFMVPLPVALEHVVEGFLQHGSAPPAFWLFKLAGTPVFRQDMVFQLPGMTLQIAPECSGIRSTLVLFITSLVAGYLFLRSPWRRTILCLAVIPLALLRNGFRVFVIGELCVHMGRHMIDSPIHHQGGPIFFALSLLPFSGLIFYLVKSDRRATLSDP
jgi:exosortase C (VPDSG-CTERM-specific)